MALSYNLGYQEIISVHPTRRLIFAGKPTPLSGTSENESYMDFNFVSRYHNRIKADPGVALMSNIKAPFGKWDALFSRYEYPLEHSY